MAGRPILITGSHRSGTNWVGTVLNESPNVAHVWEPFHLNHDIGACGATFVTENTYVTEANEADYLDHFRRTLELRYNLVGALSHVIGPRGLHRGRLSRAKRFRACSLLATGFARFLYHRLRRSRPLLQDPRAVFSAEWLAARFDAQVIITIRHPAAFAGSLKVKGWRFPFRDLLRQPLLIERYLRSYVGEIEDFANTERDIVDQAGLLWKLIHHVVSDYRAGHPEWLIVRNEDLSRDPVGGFRTVFDGVGLEYSPEIRESVRFHSELEGATQPRPRRVHAYVKRHSASNVHSWKTRLTSEEVARVRRRVAGVGEEFYREDEW